MPFAPAPGPYMDRSSTQKTTKDIYLKFTSGASGAVPSTLTLRSGVTSVTRTGTGAYTVVLDQYFDHSVGFTQSIQQASYAKTGACDCRKITSVGSTATFTLLTVDGDGDAVDMASGDIIELCFTVSNSSGL